MIRYLTGMQASGDPHWGNYFGMLQRTISLQHHPQTECFWFIADLHSFTSNQDPAIFRGNLQRAVIDWLALGIDPNQSVFYRQSDIADLHTELTWYLSCFTPIGLLERAHSFKDKTARGIEANTGLFIYPVLMAADILLYDAHKVPVGKDQIQHLEITRDIAQRFNHQYGEIFRLPEVEVLEASQTVLGLDGQKMSKSYGNSIEIFAEESVLKKKIMSIKTGSEPLGSPLDPDQCPVFNFHQLFANPNLEALKAQYLEGSIGYGEAKKQLFEMVWEYFRPARERREKFLNSPDYVQEVLSQGAKRARALASEKLSTVRNALGLPTPLT